ncbi:MAG: DUF4097 family beta strand repeat-containing protein [Pyrinomonadaceae bacterium]
MSLLYSIIFAGLMFSTDGNLSVHKNYNYTENTSEIVSKADETERFEQTYPLDAGGRVSVSNVNGSITVETWDRNEVKLEYVKTADTKELLAAVEVKIDARQDAFKVETNYDNWKTNNRESRNYGKLQVEYHLIVPRNAVLNEIETVNGSVAITGAGNSTKASAVNGQVKATNLRGAAKLSTVNGTVAADFDELQTGGKISLETVNGTAELTIPSDANATVKADTVNGQINNDFGLPVRKGQYVGRDLYGRIGSGNVQIRLNSVNGALSIKRKNDGKTPNAVTNLLSDKNDEDWDDGDNGSRVKPPRPPKPPRPNTPPAPPVPPVPNIEIDNEAIRKSVEEALKQINTGKIKLGKLDEKALKEATANLKTKEMQAQMKAAQDRYKAALALMANANWTNGSPNIEEKSESFAVKDKPKITIEAGNSSVSVRGWDKAEVRYAVTRISKSRDDAPLDIKTAQNGSDVSIKIAGSGGTGPEAAFFRELNNVRLEIFVPKKSDLKISASGEIRLEGVSGDIDLQGADEAVNVRDSDGKLSVGTNDGRIRVIGFRGAFDGKTGDGAMNLEGDFQTFNALAANGTIVLTLPENANVRLESSSEIESDGVNLIRENAKEKVWRIGKGGATYRMNVGDGKVIVRSAGEMKSN